MSYLSSKIVPSSSNNSTTALNNGETFTGTAELNGYNDVMVYVKTDQNGVLYVEFSPDGTNWDTSLTFQYNTSRINPPHIFEKGYRYFRVRFENNSGSNQTYFRLNTDFGSGLSALTSPINGTVSENYDAINVRPTKYEDEVAMSKRQGRRLWSLFASNTDVDIATSPEIIGNTGGNIAIMTTADTVDIVSDSTGDSSSGTGANTLLLEGIDENYLYQSEIITMDSTSPVTSSNQWLGINRAYVLSSGSNNYNDGNITVSDTSGAVGTQCYIKANESVSHDGWFHTQINHNFLLKYVNFTGRQESGGGAPRLTFEWFSYSRVTETTYKIGETFIDTAVENSIVTDLGDFPLVIGGREVLYFEVTTNRDNAPVSLRFSGIEERIL